MCYIRDNKNKSGSRIKVIHLVSNQEKIEHYNPSAPLLIIGESNGY